MTEKVEMNCVRMTQEIRSLSRSKLKEISGFTKESLVEEFTSEWVAWVLFQDINRKWTCWQHCLKDYEDYLVEEHESG